MESQLNTHKHIFICIFLFFSFFLFFVLGWVEFQLVFFARHSTRKLILESIARQLRLRSHDRYELDLLLLFVYLVVGVVCLFFFSSFVSVSAKGDLELKQNLWGSLVSWKDQSLVLAVVAHFCQQIRYQFIQLASFEISAKKKPNDFAFRSQYVPVSRYRSDGTDGSTKGSHNEVTEIPHVISQINLCLMRFYALKLTPF